MLVGDMFYDEVKLKEEQLMTLSDVKPGEKCKILCIDKTNIIRKRLIDMGLTTGTEIYVRKYAPFGDPIEITVRGYELSLRKFEASLIQVCLS